MNINRTKKIDRPPISSGRPQGGVQLSNGNYLVNIKLDENNEVVKESSNNKKMFAFVDKMKSNLSAKPLLYFDNQQKILKESKYKFVGDTLSEVAHIKDLKDFVKKEEGKSLSEENLTIEEKETISKLKNIKPIEKIIIQEKEYERDEEGKVNLPYRDWFSIGGFANKEEGSEAVNGSVAFGYKAKALTPNSYAFGINVKTSAEGQLVIGANNKPEPNKAFIIGGGSCAEEYNIFSIDCNGSVYAGEDRLVKEKDVIEKINALEERIKELEKLQLDAEIFKSDPPAAIAVDNQGEVENE